MDRKNRLIRHYGIAVCLLAAISVGLYMGKDRMEVDIARLRAENDAAEAFAKEPPGDRRWNRESSGLQAAAETVQKEISLVEVSEEMPSAMIHGDIHTLRLKGTGHFHDLLHAFDVIHAQGNWLTVDVRRIERVGETLRFELDLSEYRERKAGSGEKKDIRY